MKTALLNDPMQEFHNAEHCLAEISLIETVKSPLFFQRRVVCYSLFISLRDVNCFYARNFAGTCKMLRAVCNDANLGGRLQLGPLLRASVMGRLQTQRTARIVHRCRITRCLIN
jgi:hypothetical protein